MSFLAVSIAFVSLWRSHLARFRPVLAVGDLRHRIYTIKSEGKQWHISSFDVPISITNAGARIGQVIGLRLRLKFPDLPIPGNYEIFPVTWEIPPSDARKISPDRFVWLEELLVTDWLPFTVLSGKSVVKHFVFERRWDEPVIQDNVVIDLEMRSSAHNEWHKIAVFRKCLTEDVWVEMTRGGSSFATPPDGAIRWGTEIFPPDLHKYTGTRNELPSGSISPPSYLVPPER